MNIRSAVISVLILAVGLASASPAETIVSASEVARRVYVTQQTGDNFQLKGVLVTAIANQGSSLAVCEAPLPKTSSKPPRAAILHNLRNHNAAHVRPGDVIDVSGTIRLGGAFNTFVVADITNCIRMAKLKTPTAPEVTVQDFFSGNWDCLPVRLSGRIRDLVPDEIDMNYTFLVLVCDSKTVYVPCSRNTLELPPTEQLIGAKVAITGLCDPSDIGGRRRIGRMLLPLSSDSISILEPPPSNPFDVRDIAQIGNLSPAEIATLGPHRATGTVLAILENRRILLRSRSANVVNIALAEGSSTQTVTPSVGDSIEAVGFPETDLYRLNLVRANWRPAIAHQASRNSITNIRARTVGELTDLKNGRRQFKPYAHGWTISLTGMVHNLPDNDKTTFQLDCNGTLVPIDVTADAHCLDNLSVGCRVTATGLCVMDSETWQPNRVFPQIRGFSLAVDSPRHLIVLSRPPWWTPVRLLIVIGTLVLSIIAILVWNAVLRHLIERRGRALFKSQIDKVESELRVAERTRLAADLHDSLSQSLTAISYQITAGNLQAADSMLHSCRTELRRCLWDLKSDALNEPDFNTAIRRTVAPVLHNADLAVRFDVPRTRMNDITAHMILSILRELVTNAVRHGRANRLRIAGALEHPASIVFSLRDNGCGFDTGRCPGPLEGHFGLSGIRDRLGRNGGTLKIRSAPGEGTSVVVTIKSTEK